MKASNVLEAARREPLALSAIKRTGRILGSGANGTVHLGYDEECGKFVAIKELSGFVVDSNDVGSDHTILATEVANEVNVMKHAHHENLVQYLGTRVNPETQHVDIVMEYVSGGTVRSLLRQNKGLRESVLRMYGRDILRGVEYLHDACRACHRDLKPDNILITPDGRCKLADFGCSRALQSTSLLRTHVGTPYYMAPEVINGEGYNESADIWSFGATLYEMAVGEPPYATASNAMAVMFRVAMEGKLPPLPGNVSSAVADIVQRCCVATPSQRPTARELLRLPFFVADLPRAPTETPDAATVPSSFRGVVGASTRNSLGGGGALTVDANLSSPRVPATAVASPPAQAVGSGVTANPNPTTADEDDFPFLSNRDDASAVKEPWRLCQVCQTALALFNCDQCADAGLRHHRFCPGCWRDAHVHQRAANHRKRPLLVPATTTTAAHSTDVRQSSVGRGGDDGGVLLSDGTFVELTAGEQSEWECGRCGTLNDGPLRNCQTCDYLR